MEDIMVSVCCLAYNHEKYIRQTLDGFVNQKTNFKYEVLIHDDASTDRTADIIREYERKYPDIIKPIYQTENQYIRRIGISQTYIYPRTRGKYLAFCEGDDYWTDENKLQKQVDLLESNPQYIACVHRYIVVDKNSEEQQVRTFGYYENGGVYTFDDFFANNLPSQLATLLMRNIFKDEDKQYPKALIKIKLSGDIKLFLLLLVYGDIYRMEDVMSAYRFISEKGGQSYSSRIRKTAVNYKYWLNIGMLENLLHEEFGLDVYFKQRRLEFALGTIKDLKKGFDWQNIKNAIIVLVKQRGTMRVLLKELSRFIKRGE